MPLQRELATAYQRLATILGGGGVSSLGNQREAAERYDTAVKLRKSLAERPDATAEDLEAYAFLQVELSRSWGFRGNMVRSEEHATNAVNLLQSAESKAPNLARAGNLATAYHQLGYAQTQPRQVARGTVVARARDEPRPEHQIESNPADARHVERYSRIAPDYANALIVSGRPADARDVARDARDRLDRAARGRPGEQAVPPGTW